jgi:hypothetical protein
MSSTDIDALIENACAAREAAYGSWGTVDPYVLAPALNPALMGGPSWPAMRQGYRQIAKPTGFILATDGLSDPFDDGTGPTHGFGIELLIESDEILGNAQGTWLIQAITQLAANAADHGGLRDLMVELGLLSIELSDVEVPAKFLSPEGRVGFMLMQPGPPLPTRVEHAGGDAMLIAAKLLTAAELAHVVEFGEEGRRDLALKFSADKSHHVSSTTRASVV